MTTRSDDSIENKAMTGSFSASKTYHNHHEERLLNSDKDLKPDQNSDHKSTKRAQRKLSLSIELKNLMKGEQKQASIQNVIQGSRDNLLSNGFFEAKRRKNFVRSNIKLQNLETTIEEHVEASSERHPLLTRSDNILQRYLKPHDNLESSLQGGSITESTSSQSQPQIQTVILNQKIEIPPQEVKAKVCLEKEPTSQTRNDGRQNEAEITSQSLASTNDVIGIEIKTVVTPKAVIEPLQGRTEPELVIKKESGEALRSAIIEAGSQARKIDHQHNSTINIRIEEGSLEKPQSSPNLLTQESAPQETQDEGARLPGGLVPHDIHMFVWKILEGLSRCDPDYHEDFISTPRLHNKEIFKKLSQMLDAGPVEELQNEWLLLWHYIFVPHITMEEVLALAKLKEDFYKLEKLSDEEVRRQEEEQKAKEARAKEEERRKAQFREIEKMIVKDHRLPVCPPPDPRYFKRKKSSQRSNSENGQGEKNDIQHSGATGTQKSPKPNTPSTIATELKGGAKTEALPTEISMDAISDTLPTINTSCDKIQTDLQPQCEPVKSEAAVRLATCIALAAKTSKGKDGATSDFAEDINLKELGLDEVDFLG